MDIKKKDNATVLIIVAKHKGLVHILICLFVIEKIRILEFLTSRLIVHEQTKLAVNSKT